MASAHHRSRRGVRRRALVVDWQRSLVHVWLASLSLTVVLSYASGGVGGGPTVGGWPTWVWIAVGSVAAISNYVAATPIHAPRLVYATALGSAAALAFARIMFVLSLPTPFDSKLTPIALWLGVIVSIVRYLGSVRGDSWDG